MRQAVGIIFPAFTTSFEGYCFHPYCDVLGKITTALGFLCNTMADFWQVPWKVGDRLATYAEVSAAFIALRATTYDLWRHGGDTDAMKAVTNIRITRADADALTLKRLRAFEVVDRARVGSVTWDALCADAQLVTMSVAWACGSEFRFPKFLAALQRGDFARLVDGVFADGCCACEVFMPPAANPGNNLTRRNLANQALCAAAQVVVDSGLDPEIITGWKAAA